MMKQFIEERQKSSLSVKLFGIKHIINRKYRDNGGDIKETEEYKELVEINKKMHALDDFDNRLDTKILDGIANWMENTATKLNTWAVQVRFANTTLPSDLRTSDLDILKKDIAFITEKDRAPRTHF